MRGWVVQSMLSALLGFGLGCGAPRPDAGESSEASNSSTADDPAPSVGPSSSSIGADTSTTSGVDSTDTTDTTTDPPSVGPAYDEVRQKSSQDSYRRDEALIDQLAYHRVRSLELDLHPEKSDQITVHNNWFVYHIDVFDDDTSCRLLSDCLADIAALPRAASQHEVITLWLDLEDDWLQAHRPVDLDTRLEQILGDALWTPSDMLARCPSVRSLAEAATDPTCGWPSLSSLRGRVIAVLAGEDTAEDHERLMAYLEDGEAAFVAPSLAGSEPLRSPDPRVAFYSAHAQELDAIADAAAMGFVVRAWGIEDESQWDLAADAGAHHLATEFVNFHQSPWTVTHDAQGWPFTCKGECEPDGPEPGFMVGVEVDSDDIWNESDSMVFLYEDLGAAPGSEWQTLVSTPNSGVEPHAKACLMARAGLAADAPYFAVCRLADNEPLRVQWRSNAGAETVDAQHDVVPPMSVDPSSAAWIRLDVANDGRCATGYGAWQRGNWVEIGEVCFDAPLTHQGLAASSNGSGPIKMLFLDPRHDDFRVEADGLTPALVGGATGQGFEGPFPGQPLGRGVSISGS